MACGGCCCCSCCSDRDADGKSFNSSNNEVVIDRHYGCSEAGALVAVIAILVLIIGAIASTIFIEDHKLGVSRHDTNLLVLICMTVSLVVAFLIMLIYCAWQRMNVRRQRAKYGRPYAADTRQRVNGHLYTSLPTSTSTQTSWLFWSSKKGNTQAPPSSGNRAAELRASPPFMPHRIYHMSPNQQRPSYSTVV